MSAALHSCQQIRDDLQTTVLVLHHPTKKDETNERGGSGFRGGCADVLNIEEKDGIFHLTTQNARDRATDDEPIPYVLEVLTLERVLDEEGAPLSSCVARHLATEEDVKAVRDKAEALDQRILQVLESGPDTKKRLARSVKKRDEDVTAALERCKKKRKVSRDKQGRWFLVKGGGGFARKLTREPSQM
jgi:hypothetical protein